MPYCQCCSGAATAAVACPLRCRLFLTCIHNTAAIALMTLREFTGRTRLRHIDSDARTSWVQALRDANIVKPQYCPTSTHLQLADWLTKPPVKHSVLNQGYQGVSGSIRNQDQGWGYQGSLISGSQAPLGTQGTSGISGISGIRTRDGGIRFSP